MKNETIKGRLLRSSVLAGVATSVAAIAVPAYAQDEAVEEIFVTGSRIAQSSYTGANPVIVFTADDIEKTGQMSVADILRDSTLNSFGSQRESSGSSQQSQASMSLRGMGNTRTLILMDGHRIAASPKIGGAVVNMNNIPTAAIERVDILTGAGSSVYGSDAAAGVVNIIMRDSYDGLTVSLQQTFPGEEGGEEMKASLVTGFETDRARVMIALDHSERELIARSDRSYDAAGGFDQNNYNLTQGASYYSRNFLASEYDEFGDPVPSATLNQEQIYPRDVCIDNPDMVNDGQIFFRPGSGHMCLYDYTPIMAYHASRQFDSAITKFSYDVTDNVEFKLRAMHNRNETFGRYAPVAGYYYADAGSVDLLIVNGGDTSGVGDGSYTVVTNDIGGYVYNRFIENGPRANTTKDYVNDILMEVIGQYNDYEWNVTANWNQQEYFDNGSGYINRELFTRRVADDGADFDASDPDTIAYYAQSISSNAWSNYRNLSGGVGGPVAFVPELEFYVGAEYYEYEFNNDYDDQSAAGNVMGSAGNDESGDREVAAMFAEFQYTNVENLQLNASARYDSYSDFGNVTTYKVSGVYDLAPVMGISEDLAFRASYGTGFIAPDLGTLYAADTFSAQFATDDLDCDIYGASPCPDNQYRTTIHNNDELDAETSNNFTVGMMGSALDGDLNWRADYFFTEVENAIGQLSLNSLIKMQEADCANNTTNLADLMAVNSDIQIARSGVNQLYLVSDGATNPTICDVVNGVAVQNAPGVIGDFIDGISGDLIEDVTGTIGSAIPISGRSHVSYTNGGQFDTHGIDASVTLVRDYDFGSFTFKADATYILEYNDEIYLGGPQEDWIGSSGMPQWRGVFGTDFERGDHVLAATVSYIDGYTTGLNSGQDIDSWTTYDLRYTWQSPWDATFSAGCRNCTNEEPPMDSFNNHNDELHNIYGLVSYVSVTANF